MTMFLVLLTYLVPVDQILPLREEHYRFADRHFATGTFLLGGRRVPPTGGFILATGVSRDRLTEILADDPYLRAGLVRHEVVELEPTRVQPALADGLGLTLS
jgi:uncharacterized protein YciI